jgi:hypothetical protein
MPISQRVRRFLLGGPELKNAISQILAGLFDFLHLLANAGSSSLVAAFGFADITLNFNYQRFKSFVLLHLIVLHLRKGYHYLGFKQPRNLKAGNNFVKEKQDFYEKNQHLFLAYSI